MAFARRDIRGGAVQTTIVGDITSGSASCSLTATTGWPDGSTNGSFYVVVDPGTASEEKILCTTRSSGTLNFGTRGADGTTAAAHAAGAVIYPIGAAADFDEANLAVSETIGKVTMSGDMIVASGANAFARLAKGSNSTVLNTSSGGSVGWGTVTSAMITDGTIATGDIGDSQVTNAKLAGMTRGTVKVGNSSGVASDLAIGTSGYVLTSDGTDAAWVAAAGDGWTTVTKGSNESVASSTTLQADDALTFTAADGTLYLIECVVIYGAATIDDPTQPGFKFSLSENAGVGRGFWRTSNSDALAGVGKYTDDSQEDSTYIDVAAVKLAMFITATHTGAGGAFRLRWCQQTTSTKAAIVYAGSYLRYRALA